MNEDTVELALFIVWGASIGVALLLAWCAYWSGRKYGR